VAVFARDAAPSLTDGEAWAAPLHAGQEAPKPVVLELLILELLVLAQHGNQLILQMQPLALSRFQVFVGSVFHTLLYAVHFVLHFMVFVKQSRKVRIVHLEFVNTILVFGQFVNEVVFFAKHDGADVVPGE
jgi:hypothetical protein